MRGKKNPHTHTHTHIFLIFILCMYLHSNYFFCRCSRLAKKKRLSAHCFNHSHTNTNGINQSNHAKKSHGSKWKVETLFCTECHTKWLLRSLSFDWKSAFAISFSIKLHGQVIGIIFEPLFQLNSARKMPFDLVILVQGTNFWIFVDFNALFVNLVEMSHALTFGSFSTSEHKRNEWVLIKSVQP